MSTCMGAPAPHDNCPHGKACDWGRKPPEAPKRVPESDPADWNRAAQGELGEALRRALAEFGKGRST